MKMSFINQAKQAQRILNALNEQVHEDQSQFQHAVDQAKWQIDRVVKTYEEVLRRDANEDQTYRSTLKEIK